MATTLELYILDEHVYEFGKWNASVGAIGAKSAPRDSGLYVQIWKKDDQGDWKIWRDLVDRWRGGP